MDASARGFLWFVLTIVVIVIALLVVIKALDRADAIFVWPWEGFAWA